MGADAMIFVFWMLSFSHVQFFPTPWTIVHQTPVSMELSRQEYWNGSHSLLQGIFLIQVSNLSLPHCMQILYHLSHEIYVYIYIYIYIWSEVKSLSHVQLFETPWTVAYYVPPSLGFSRQEHCSGLLFPSPMQESEKWKWSCSVVSNFPDPMDCSLPGSSIHGSFQARVLEWGAIAFSDICIYIYIYIYIHIHKSISEGKFKRLIMREGVNITVYFFLIPPNWNGVYNDFCINVEPNSLSEQMASLILEGQKFHLFFSIRFSENPKWNFWSPQYF